MNPMKDALKGKRQGGMLMAEMNDAPAAGQSGGGDMKALADTLSHAQKAELIAELAKSLGGKSSETSPMDIAKGAPSDDEKSEIDARMQSDDDTGEGDGVDEPDEDDDMASFLDGAKTSEAPPRNLGDRVKQSVASKLKAKGKM